MGPFSTPAQLKGKGTEPLLIDVISVSDGRTKTHEAKYITQSYSTSTFQGFGSEPRSGCLPHLCSLPAQAAGVSISTVPRDDLGELLRQQVGTVGRNDGTDEQCLSWAQELEMGTHVPHVCHPHTGHILGLSDSVNFVSNYLGATLGWGTSSFVFSR